MKALFVSPEHQQLTLYRTHPAYRSIFFVIVFWLIVQIGLAVLFSHNKTDQFALAERHQKAVEAEKLIAPEEAALVPLLKKMELTKSWSPALTERTWMGDLLSRIDRNIPPEICLTEISIHNRFPSLKAPDHIAIEIHGAAQAGGTAAWQAILQTQFPTWRVIPVREGQATTTGEIEDGLADNLTAFTFLLQQPAASPKGKK